MCMHVRMSLCACVLVHVCASRCPRVCSSSDVRACAGRVCVCVCVVLCCVVLCCVVSGCFALCVCVSVHARVRAWVMLALLLLGPYTLFFCFGLTHTCPYTSAWLSCHIPNVKQVGTSPADGFGLLGHAQASDLCWEEPSMDQYQCTGKL